VEGGEVKSLSPVVVAPPVVLWHVLYGVTIGIGGHLAYSTARIARGLDQSINVYVGPG